MNTPFWERLSTSKHPPPSLPVTAPPKPANPDLIKKRRTNKQKKAREDPKDESIHKDKDKIETKQEEEKKDNEEEDVKKNMEDKDEEKSDVEEKNEYQDDFEEDKDGKFIRTMQLLVLGRLKKKILQMMMIRMETSRVITMVKMKRN